MTDPGYEDVCLADRFHTYAMASSVFTFSMSIFGWTGFSRNASTGR
jgi:hypothetical protein